MFLKICNELLQDEEVMSRFVRREKSKSLNEIPLENKPDARYLNCC